jgi:hypothetical protein
VGSYSVRFDPKGTGTENGVWTVIGSPSLSKQVPLVYLDAVAEYAVNTMKVVGEL